MPGPSCVRLPVPPMALPAVTLSDRLKTSEALLVMLLAEAIEPVVPPAPICSVPVLIVVAPV